jgi:sugar lactone lactonase YvrE
MIGYFHKEGNSLKTIYIQLIILLFLLQCLKAERAPFDIGNQSSGTGQFLIILSGNTTSEQSSVSNNSSVSTSATFQYSQSTYISYTGTSLSIPAPTVTEGSLSSFSISPSLPPGLQLDQATGAISGTPSGLAIDQRYTVTGKSSGVESNTSFTLKIGSTAASGVIGQTNFTFTGGGAGVNNLNWPHDLCFDSTGKLYVADTGNNRVVAYAPGSTTITDVYGQFGNFYSNVANNGGLSADSLSAPRGVSVDSSGNLYISDYSNNRVLFYNAGSNTPSRVYGQLGSYFTSTINNGGVNANSSSGPYRLTVDSVGNLYVPNIFTHRVLFYPAGSTTATKVYGQFDVLTTSTLNNGGVSANSLYAPIAIKVDTLGNVYIADRQNNRVLYYPNGSTTATRVYGQLGSFTSNIANNGGISADSLNSPNGITIDEKGNLYIADTGNNRVLYYPNGSTTATRVYGQSDSFTSNIANNGGVSANSLNTPYAVALDSNHKLYVVDNGNNRIAVFYVP